jgi:hypothetical protein
MTLAAAGRDADQFVLARSAAKKQSSKVLVAFELACHPPRPAASRLKAEPRAMTDSWRIQRFPNEAMEEMS